MRAPIRRGRSILARAATRSTIFLFFSGSVAITTGACAPEKSTSIPNGDAGETDAARACAPCEGQSSPSERCLRTVDVEVRDESGGPARDLPVACCGKNLCVYARTDESGAATIRVCHAMSAPALKLYGGRAYVSFAAPLARGGGETPRVPAFRITRFPSSGAAFPTDAQPATLASNGVRLELTSGAQAKVSELDHPEPDDRLFRAARVPPEGIAEGLLPGDVRIDLVYGFAPQETKLDPGATVDLPNELAWPAGAPVDAYVHGVNVDDAVAPYGGWRYVSTGAVSTDGARIRVSGVNALTLLGLRRK
jgi:hypothetical protein